jgi:hypothetical protein
MTLNLCPRIGAQDILAFDTSLGELRALDMKHTMKCLIIHFQL